MDTPSDLGNPALPIELEDQQTVIPDFEIDTLVRCLLPKIQAYFSSQEGREAFWEWQRQHNNKA